MLTERRKDHSPREPTALQPQGAIIDRIIRRYQDLQSALARLPAPRRGYVRVFRGQTADYGVMIPAGLRPASESAVRSQAWPLYASLVAHDLRAQAGHGPEYLGEDVLLHAFWVNAIKQHYGPGTEFLDVTRSPSIAAWFALHRPEVVKAQAVYGYQGPVDPERDVFAAHGFVRYRPHTESPGVFYALDVRKPEGLPHPRHGELLDLSVAPPAFSSSPRIRVQHACLIFADRATNHGNLSPFYVPGTPLRVAWPLDGCPEMEWPTEQVFPPPSKDEWYARFVAIPLTPTLDPSADRTIFDHPIPVGLYEPERSHDQLEDLTRRMGIIPPALVFADVMDRERHTDEFDQNPALTRVAAATPILLEGPVFYPLPPVESNLWNPGLLAGDLADEAPARDLVTGNPVAPVTLRNVFIELSPLEQAGWETVEQAGASLDVLRAVWLVRDSDQWLVTLFTQTLPDTRLAMAGPVAVRYDQAKNGFGVWLPRTHEWRPLRELWPIARPFVKCLSLVRDLSPLPKVAAYPTLRAGDEWIVHVQHALGELASLAGLKGPIARYYVLRQPGGKDVFLGGAPSSSPAIVGGLKITASVPFSEMDPFELREAAVEAFVNRTLVIVNLEKEKRRETEKGKSRRRGRQA